MSVPEPTYTIYQGGAQGDLPMGSEAVLFFPTDAHGLGIGCFLEQNGLTDAYRIRLNNMPGIAGNQIEKAFAGKYPIKFRNKGKSIASLDANEHSFFKQKVDNFVPGIQMNTSSFTEIKEKRTKKELWNMSFDEWVNEITPSRNFQNYPEQDSNNQQRQMSQNYDEIKSRIVNEMKNIMNDDELHRALYSIRDDAERTQIMGELGDAKMGGLGFSIFYDHTLELQQQHAKRNNIYKALQVDSSFKDAFAAKDVEVIHRLQEDESKDAVARKLKQVCHNLTGENIFAGGGGMTRGAGGANPLAPNGWGPQNNSTLANAYRSVVYHDAEWSQKKRSLKRLHLYFNAGAGAANRFPVPIPPNTIPAEPTEFDRALVRLHRATSDDGLRAWKYRIARPGWWPQISVIFKRNADKNLPKLEDIIEKSDQIEKDLKIIDTLWPRAAVPCAVQERALLTQGYAACDLLKKIKAAREFDSPSSSGPNFGLGKKKTMEPADATNMVEQFFSSVPSGETAQWQILLEATARPTQTELDQVQVHLIRKMDPRKQEVVKNAVKMGNSPISNVNLTAAGAGITFDQSFAQTDTGYIGSLLQNGTSGVLKANIMLKSSRAPQHYLKSHLSESLKEAFNDLDKWGVKNKGKAFTRS